MSPAPVATPAGRLALALLVGLLVGLLGACVVESRTIDCGDGVRCPSGLICVSGPGTCARAWQVAACVDLPDEEPCDFRGLPGRCKQGICESALECEHASDCNDDNPCTDDVCDQGECEHRVNDAPCDDGVLCNGPERCTAGVCENIGQAPCAETTQCDELAQTCTGCLGDDDCPAPTYTAWSDCTAGSDICAFSGLRSRLVAHWQCNAEGVCQKATVTETEPCPLATNGKSCDDGIACTAGDQCLGGACTGQPLDCDDGNPCTRDGCDASGACTHDAEPFGTLCLGGNCDGQGTCLACPGAGAACLSARACALGQGFCDASGDYDCFEVGPRPAGTACRPAANGCDRAEHCDGASLDCPDDLPLPDGTCCGPDGEQCRAGVCLLP